MQGHAMRSRRATATALIQCVQHARLATRSRSDLSNPLGKHRNLRMCVRNRRMCAFVEVMICCRLAGSEQLRRLPWLSLPGGVARLS